LSQRPRDPGTKTWAVVTNATRLRGREVRATSAGRWWVEVLLKELRGTPGRGSDQVLDEPKVVQHLHRCGLADPMLTHPGPAAGGAQAEAAPAGRATPRPLGQRPASPREALGRACIQSGVKRARPGPCRRRLMKRLQEFATAA